MDLEQIWEDDALAEKIGKKIAKTLRLQEEDGLFKTDWGVKSEIGLARCVAAIIADETPPTKP